VPELPEVETIRRRLAEQITGRRVVAADAHESAKFAPARDAIGAAIDDVGRRGKYLLFSLDDGSTLRYRDVRRFGRIAVVKAGDHAAMPTLATQGPDPFDDAFTSGALWRALQRSNARVKTQLLSQRPVAGVGNIYADEALWRAGIDPGRRSITKAEAARLHAALRDVLAQGIANGGTTLRDYRTFDGGVGANQHELDCYGRHGEPCHRCATILVRRVLDGRGTTHCPDCQPRRPRRPGVRRRRPGVRDGQSAEAPTRSEAPASAEPPSSRRRRPGVRDGQ
jgi:formamidopyrimidine-DNA glycosylase